MFSKIVVWLIVLLALALFGCVVPLELPPAPPGGTTYINGPISLTLYENHAVIHEVCTKIVGPAPKGFWYVGCMAYPARIFCAKNDYDCLAHEFRHAFDPWWDHAPGVQK